MKNEPRKPVAAAIDMKSILCAAMLTALGLGAGPAVAQDPSGCTHRVVINKSGARPSSVNKDPLHVRTGDKVCWKIAGSRGADFYISYPGPSPTNSPSRANRGWVVHEITAEHTGNESIDTYKYDVVIPRGGRLDPKIIVDR